jgi:hypothetical protein
MTTLSSGIESGCLLHRRGVSGSDRNRPGGKLRAFGRQAIWLKVESPDGYDTTVNACACCRLTPRNLQARCDAELTKAREATARSANWLPTLSASRLSIPAKPTSDRRLVHLLIDGTWTSRQTSWPRLAVGEARPNAWRERRRHWCGY